MGKFYNYLLLVAGVVLLFVKKILPVNELVSLLNISHNSIGIITLCGAIITLIAVMKLYSQKQIATSLKKD